jgi:hypothetical protein
LVISEHVDTSSDINLQKKRELWMTEMKAELEKSLPSSVQLHTMPLIVHYGQFKSFTNIVQLNSHVLVPTYYQSTPEQKQLQESALEQWKNLTSLYSPRMATAMAAQVPLPEGDDVDIEGADADAMDIDEKPKGRKRPAKGGRGRRPSKVAKAAPVITPDEPVIGVPASEMIMMGGALHCISRTIPSANGKVDWLKKWQADSNGAFKFGSMTHPQMFLSEDSPAKKNPLWF